ncbi:butyrate kinase [Deferribacter thermophilus]|uniref:butyrate kinase n=1 Tax=Deferribacter thermophilus TaxID=53573 RepID=UPI003C25FBDF
MNILAIDPGSTSTKIGIFSNDKLMKYNIEHLDEEFIKIVRVIDQEVVRFNNIKHFLVENNLYNLKFDAVVARGGLLKPIEGGVYQVNDKILNDLKCGVNGEHPANLGGILAMRFAKIYDCKAYIVDPPVIDEMWEIAKITGIKDILRKSKFHALNHKEVARRIAINELGKKYEESTLIVAHLGGGITIGLHKNGKVVDVNNGLDGDGPFAVERAGGLPIDGLIDFMEKNNISFSQLKRIISKESGIFSLLKTKNMKDVEKLYNTDNYVKTVVEAFVYNIVKEIGSLYAAACGLVDALVITGGLAKSEFFMSKIKEYLKFLDKIFIVPGEYEIEALVNGAIRVLKGEEDAKIYE